MKTQKSDNNGNIAKAPASQSQKPKVGVRTAKPKVEKKEDPKSLSQPAGRKKVAGTLQSEAAQDRRVSVAEEELQARISKRAYELYEFRGWQHGDDQADWFQATTEVLAQKSGGR